MIHRGDIFEADLPGVGDHPVVVVTRDVAIPVLSAVTVVLVTSTIRGHRAEVPLGREQGLDHESVANCDQVFTLSKGRLGTRRGQLGPAATAQINAALMLALELD